MQYCMTGLQKVYVKDSSKGMLYIGSALSLHSAGTVG